MAHHSGQNGPGSGIESITPPTGMFTGLGMFAAFVIALWVIVTHPRAALKVVVAAVPMAWLIGDPMNHPIPFLVVGFFVIRWATKHEATKEARK